MTHFDIFILSIISLNSSSPVLTSPAIPPGGSYPHPDGRVPQDWRAFFSGAEADRGLAAIESGSDGFSPTPSVPAWRRFADGPARVAWKPPIRKGAHHAAEISPRLAEKHFSHLAIARDY